MKGGGVVNVPEYSPKDRYLEAKGIVDRFVHKADLGEQQAYDIDWLEKTYSEYAEEIRIYFYDNWELSYKKVRHD